MKYILASKSPRRKELLQGILPNFSILTANGDEQSEFVNASQYVQALAKQKGDEILSQTNFNPDERIVLISADTIVYANGIVLGKPKTEEDAFQMLSSLSGKKHQVYTGVCVSVIENSHLSKQISFDECTDVFVMELSTEEIRTYIDTKDPFDKAGGYGIQGIFGRHIEKIEGDYFNVVGLPVHHLYCVLKDQKLI